MINGNSPSSKVDGALSLISAKVFDTLQVVEPAITVHHFCGLHQAQGDPLTSSRGMMNSVLGQLLSQRKYGFDLSITTTGNLEMLREGGLKEICNTFAVLMDQLPPGSVLVCVLGGISFYETSAREGDTIKVIRYLVKLVRRAKKMSFKLLLTCPGESCFQNEYGIRENEMLLLDEEQVDDDGQGYNDGVFEEDIVPLVVEDELDLSD